jgi:hypothetical protein
LCLESDFLVSLSGTGGECGSQLKGRKKMTTATPTKRTNDKREIDFSLVIDPGKNPSEKDVKEAESLARMLTKAVEEAMKKHGLTVTKG